MNSLYEWEDYADDERDAIDELFDWLVESVAVPVPGDMDSAPF